MPFGHFYTTHTRSSGFHDKKTAISIAEEAKKKTPSLGVRIVQVKRKIIKVCKG